VKFTKKILNKIIKEEVQNVLSEKTVRLSTMKDANFVPGQFVQLMGKKGMVKLDKKSVHSLAKIIRTQFGKGKGMGWSFTSEGKLTEKTPWQGYKKHAVHGKAEVDFLNLISGHPDWKKYNKLTDKGKNVIFFTKKDPNPLVWQTSNGREVQATDLKGSKSSYKSYKVGDIYKVLVEGKLTEDYKNNKWEVYVADEKGREKIVKVAKSKRAGVILYNKLINTDKYHEVGMRVIKEGKLTESSPYKTASRNELAMYISQLSTTIKNTKDRKMLNMLKKDKKEVEKELKSRKTNEGNIGITTKKGKTIELTHKTSGKEIVVVNNPGVLKKYKKLGYLISMPEGKLNEGISVADTRFVGKFVIHILSSGNEMRSAILSKKNNSKYGTRDKKDLKTLWDLAGKYKGKEIKEGKLNEGTNVVTLPNGIKVKIDFNGLTFIGGTKPVFLDRKEMEIFFKATARYLK
jgi:hypothetical protein